ncbi:MAG: thiol peroxidase [Sedimentisphaerales bacterium]|nr:thiol peroxidase [Sedimentisphaerales bacterium]
MTERNDVIKFKGNPLTLLGNELKVGNTAPDAEVLANDLSPIKISSYKGKICVICTVPSLDTSVCDIQTRKFNKQAISFGDDVVVLTISMDLPFAQARWCGSANVKNVKTLSDHAKAEFGNEFGVLIKELRLLARTVFVVDKKGIIRYIEVVEELTNEPDYEAALKAIREITK